MVISVTLGVLCAFARVTVFDVLDPMFRAKNLNISSKADKTMTQGNQSAPVTKKQLWAGRIMSALPALFLLVDGGMKLVKPAPVVEATVRLGYRESVIVGLGIVLLACTVVYLVPRTSILGAILLTGYLGGAVATQVRAGEGWFPILFPVILGVLVWGGLFLRDDRLRALIPWRSSA